MINLKEVITKYPECLESASKLRSYLVDLYPQEKRNINIITTIFECGIAEEIKNAQGEIDDITIHSYCNRLENDYAYSVAFSRECVLLWSDAYKKVVNNDSKGTEKKVSGGLHIEKGVLKDIGTCYCRHVVIPNIVTRIEEKAFKNCDNIISVTIPDSVTSIGDWAFENCKNLCENLIAQGKSQMGKALLSLNDKMSRTGYLKNFGNGGYCCPIFIIISGSEPVDDCDKPIIELNKNNLFRYAFQMALCVGNNINKTILRALCKNDEYHWIGNEEEKLGEIVISIKDTESIKSFFHDYMRDFYS